MSDYEKYKPGASVIAKMAFGKNNRLVGDVDRSGWAAQAFRDRVAMAIADHYQREDATARLAAACAKLTTKDLEAVVALSEKFAAKARQS
jgi:hypothetical protein